MRQFLPKILKNFPVEVSFFFFIFRVTSPPEGSRDAHTYVTPFVPSLIHFTTVAHALGGRSSDRDLAHSTFRDISREDIWRDLRGRSERRRITAVNNCSRIVAVHKPRRSWFRESIDPFRSGSCTCTRVCKLLC